MNEADSIYVAGYRGLAGSALVRALRMAGYQRIVTATHAEVDLLDYAATRTFFAAQRPQYLFMAAARYREYNMQSAYGRTCRMTDRQM